MTVGQGATMTVGQGADHNDCWAGGHNDCWAGGHSDCWAGGHSDCWAGAKQGATMTVGQGATVTWAWVKVAPEHSGFPEYKIKLKNNSGIAILSSGIRDCIGGKNLRAARTQRTSRNEHRRKPDWSVFFASQAVVVPGRNTSRLLRMRTLH